MKRTKTAELIYEQSQRIMDGFSLMAWDGKEYVNHDGLMKRLYLVREITEKYVNNIYKLVGVDKYETDAATANEIYHNFRVETKKYMSLN